MLCRALLTFVRASLASQAAMSPSILALHQEDAIIEHSPTPDEVHRNVMYHMPAENVVKVADLNQYFDDNAGKNHTIYIPDFRTFVSMSDVGPAPSVLHAPHAMPPHPGVVSRVNERPPVCHRSFHRWTANTGSHWDSWRPISHCMYNGLGQATAGQTISYTTTKTIDVSFGVDLGEIAKILSLSLGIDVTQSWSQTDSYRCDVPPHNVGQLWGQNFIAWGDIYSQWCTNCDTGIHSCEGAHQDGHATAPVNGKFNPGCSTGYDHVSCNTSI